MKQFLKFFLLFFVLTLSAMENGFSPEEWDCFNASSAEAVIAKHREIIAQFSENNLLEKDCPQLNLQKLYNTCPPDQYYLKLNFLASFLKKQEAMITYVEEYIQALENFLESNRLFEEKYHDVGILSKNISFKRRTFSCSNSPACISSFLCLNRADESNLSPEEKTVLTETLATLSDDRKLQAALLWKKSSYQTEIRYQKMMQAFDAVFDFRIHPLVLDLLIDFPGYSYPYCRLFQLITNYLAMLELHRNF